MSEAYRCALETRSTSLSALTDIGWDISRLRRWTCSREP